MKPSVRALYPAPGPDLFVGLGGDVEVRALSTLDGCAVTYRAAWRGQEVRLTVATRALEGDPIDAVEGARHALFEPLPPSMRLGFVECDDGAHLFLCEPWRAGDEAPRGAAGVAEAWAQLRELTSALATWHAAGRAHGALSPLSLDGLAWADRVRAALGLVAVDPAWAAPEHLEPRLGAVSPATDVFSLGALFFQRVRGTPPFAGLSPGARCAALLDRRERPSLRAAGVPVAAAVDKALARLLAVDPSARPADAAAAYALLGEAVLSAPEPGGPPRALPRFVVAPREPATVPRRIPADPRVVAAACAGIVTVALAGEPLVARLFAETETKVAVAPTSSAVAPAPKVATASAPPPTAAPAASPTASVGPDRAALLADVLPVPKDAPRFLLDRTEVPVQLYAACVAEGACPTTRKRGTGYRADDPLRREWLCNLHREGRATHPVNCVSRPMAAAFCAWAGKRLPTDKEWTLAVGDKQFPWGDGGLRCDRAVFARYGPDQGGCRKQPVGTMPVDVHPDGAGPHGHLELAGSLWEWVSSPSEHGLGLLRGGAWDGNEHALGKAGRLEQTVDNADVTLGVRCAKDL